MDRKNEAMGFIGVTWGTADVSMHQAIVLAAGQLT